MSDPGRVTYDEFMAALNSLREATEMGFARVDRRLDEIDRGAIVFEHRMMRRFDAIDDRFERFEKRMKRVERRIS